MQHRLTHLLFVALVFFVLSPLTLSADSKAPFVAGFDRFARHNSIDQSTSGQLIISELSCTACHASDHDLLQPKRGPILDGVASRTSSDWVKQYLVAPNHVKPGTTMPDVLAALPDAEKQKTASVLTAFLSTLQEPFAEIKASGVNPVPLDFWDRGDTVRGMNLYHEVGCVACHAPDLDFEVPQVTASPMDKMLAQLDQNEIAEMGLESAARKVESIPLPDLPAKYTSQGLTYFLLNPEHIRPSGRMPNFNLGAVDAADIAAYLLRKSLRPSNVESEVRQEQEAVEQGRLMFASLGCINCHSVRGIKTSEPSPPRLAALNLSSPKSCVGVVTTGVPNFAVDEVQKSAILQAISTLSNSKVAAAEVLHLRMLQLNCYACHDRNKLGGVGRFRRPYFETVGNVDIGDEGRLPPPLTGIGSKLTPAALKSVISGKDTVRPHMHIRMPVFPATQLKQLPDLFAAIDNGGSQPSESDVFGRFASLAEDGRALMDVGCVQCHSFKGESLPGTVGVDLTGITSRVHPKWFREFLHNPTALKERTRMPSFFPNGKSQNRDILNGDTEMQIAAMWAYLKDINRQEIPGKILNARNQDYELVPKDGPIVLRTFMPVVGTHAIAVGFPDSVHFAFDAEKMRLAQAWRGRFLDARGTWFERFTPPANPLGQQLAIFPESVPFAMLIDENQTWPSDAGAAGYRFRGYRLDETGNPTFLYQFGNYDVEDEIKPSDAQGLTRRFLLKRRDPNTALDRSLWMRGHQGTQLRFNEIRSYSNEAGVSIKVSRGIVDAGELRKNGPKSEWILPLPIEQDLEIEVVYSW